MYELLLKTNWDEILQKDVIIKTNTVRHILTIKGSELVQNDDSIIIVYYNIVTGAPYILVQVYTREVPDMKIPEIEGFNGSCVYENGITEIMYVKDVIWTLDS